MDQQMSKKESRDLMKQEKEAKQARQEKMEMMKKIGIGLVVVAIVVGIIVLVKSTKKGVDEVVDLSPDPAIGPENGAVVVKEYADFQCPGCAGAYPLMRDLLEEYGDLVRYQYNDFPLPQHQHAANASVGAECAFAQGKFFEFADLVYGNQTDWSSKNNEEEVQGIFRGYAEQAGIDVAQFDSCVGAPDAADHVNEDIAEARQLNVNSTPTFFVNGERVVDQPFSTSIREAIDAALAEKGLTKESTDQTTDEPTNTNETGDSEQPEQPEQAEPAQ